MTESAGVPSTAYASRLPGTSAGDAVKYLCRRGGRRIREGAPPLRYALLCHRGKHARSHPPSAPRGTHLPRVMAWDWADLSLVGAHTRMSQKSALTRAVHRACSPGAVMPSSLDTRTRGRVRSAMMLGREKSCFKACTHRDEYIGTIGSGWKSSQDPRDSSRVRVGKRCKLSMLMPHPASCSMQHHDSINA